jgi:Multiubiquitin
MAQQEQTHEVKIFIDQNSYHSPNPTMGAALYVLGKVQPSTELFREVTGDREDSEVDNGPESVHLKQDEHFHSGKPKVYKIIVNGRQKEVLTKALTFDQVVAWAFNPVPSGPNVQFTVTYRKGLRKNHEGSMTEDESVRVKDGMIFDVTETNKS